MRSLAASAGYMVGIAADRVYAREGTITAINGNQNQANKFQMTLFHDRANSDPALSEF